MIQYDQNLGPTPDARQVGKPVSAKELELLHFRCSKVVHLDFWGAKVNIWVGTKEEADDWRVFYRYFVASSAAKSDFDLFLDVDKADGGNFLRSIFGKDGLPKKMILRGPGPSAQVLAQFERWSTVATPLPPFRFPPLNNKLAVINAGSVQSAQGQGILFVAPPYQGKSTLVNAIVERGGSPLADNISVLDINTTKILPYLTPSGVREETIDHLSPARKAIDSMDRPFRTISEVTGPVYLLHFDTLFPEAKAPVPTPLTDIIFLSNERGQLGELFSFDSIPEDLALRGLRRYRIDTNINEDIWEQKIMGKLHNCRFRVLRFDLINCNLDDVIDGILS